MSITQDSSVTEQEPVKQSLCQSLRRDTHWKCLALSMLISGCMAAIIWCRITRVTKNVIIHNIPYESEETGPCVDGYVYIPIAFIVLLYLVYIVECWHCHTRLELQCKVDVTKAYAMINAMRNAIPIVWWKSVCYHYVRKSRQVTRYRNGDAYTTTQVYYDRINSHTASSCFNFIRCGTKDISSRLIKLENYPATKVRLTKGFSFSNFEAEQEYEEQRTQFFHSYERMDDYMETREGMDLMNVDFKPYMIVFTDPDNLPWYVSHKVFWIASIVLMSWPLRVFIEYQTAYIHFHAHKLFGSNYAVVQHFNSGQTSRFSSMRNGDVENYTHKSDYTMVPSYSEALLMDCPDRQGMYGTLNKPNGSIPLANMGNSTCSTHTARTNHILSPGQEEGTTYSNINANGYIPLASNAPNKRNYNSSSSETVGNIKRKRKRKHKRNKYRPQSYINAIEQSNDCRISENEQQARYSKVSTQSTPESLSEHSFPRESSMDSIDSLGGDISSSNHELSESVIYCAGQANGGPSVNIKRLKNDQDLCKSKTSVNQQPNTTSYQSDGPANSSPVSDPPPSYELVMAMRRAAASAAGIVSETNSGLLSHPSGLALPPENQSMLTVARTVGGAERPNTLFTSRTLRSTSNVHHRPFQPIRVKETTL